MPDSTNAIEHRPVIIVGSGIAGLTAAIYAARANNDPLVIEGDEPGGQLTLTTDVENYPGFESGVNGPELVSNMKEQARRFGADIEHGVVNHVEHDDRPFTVVLKGGDAYTCDALIAASGSSARTLEVPGEDDLMGYGLSTCATCDGAFFRDEDMLLVGGGDAAAEEAIFLTKFADTVYVAHRRDELRAEGYLRDRLMEKVDEGAVEILWNTEVTEIHGTREDGVDRVSLVSNDSGRPKQALENGEEVRERDFDVGAVFYAIGHTPNTDYLKETDVELDESGYIVTAGGRGSHQTETDVTGLFGAGDVVDFHYQQAVTAAGMGCKAAMDADEYVSRLDD